MVKKPKSLQEAAELADDYTTARRGENRGQQRAQGGNCAPTRSQGVRRVQTVSTSELQWGVRQRTGPSRNRTNEKGERQCFECHEWGTLVQLPKA